MLLGDGLGGEPLRAPYDRIIVTAAAERSRRRWSSNWPTAASWCCRSGPHDGAQELVKLTKSGQGIERESLIPVRFVPLLPGQAQEL